MKSMKVGAHQNKWNHRTLSHSHTYNAVIHDDRYMEIYMIQFGTSCITNAIEGSSSITFIVEGYGQW